MARRRWFARDVVASMGCCCVIILALGGCGVLAVDSTAMEPSAEMPRAEEGGCYRPLSDVIWGFLVTLLALTVSMWGSRKYIAGDTALDVANTFLASVFIPHFDLLNIVDSSRVCVSLLWNCHKMRYSDLRITSTSWLKFLCWSLFPWSKSPARILASCEIVVYVSKESPLLQNSWLWRMNIVKDESEAMVVGENGARAIRNDQYVRKELSRKGIGWLVWKEVFCGAQDSKRLPKYNELKYLRGNSGFAIIAIAIQAFGYIYAVGFRGAKNLRISPLEAIGLIFNIIILMKVFFYSTSNPCHRPLVIYMDKDWEQEVAEFNDNEQEKFEHYDYYSYKVITIIFFGIFFGISALLIYYIVHIVKATNVMVGIPVVLFLLGLGLELLATLVAIKSEDMGYYIIFVGCLLTAMSYIWALVGTVLYWRTMHFNTRGDLINLSQIIPFIG